MTTVLYLYLLTAAFAAGFDCRNDVVKAGLQFGYNEGEFLMFLGLGILFVVVRSTFWPITLGVFICDTMKKEAKRAERKAETEMETSVKE